MSDTKACTTCGKDKPITTFNLNGPSGTRRKECRACAKTRKRRRQGVQPRAPRRAPTPKPKQRPLSRTRMWMNQLIAENPQAAQLPYYTLKYRARYRFDDEFRAREILRRQLRDYDNMPTDGTLTSRVVRDLFVAATHCCYCTTPLHPRTKTLDHIIPRSRGGMHSITNVSAVSYTHLRAHETPEHLVCRLLLEKKNA